MNKTKIAAAFMLGACAIAWTAPAPAPAAEAYPNKSITMIVPFPAGGPTDIVARIVGHKLSEELGRTVVIDNKPGASSVIGAGEVRGLAQGQGGFVRAADRACSNRRKAHDLCFLKHRGAGASCGRAVRPAVRAQSDARAIPRQCAGIDGSDRRAGRHDVR